MTKSKKQAGFLPIIVALIVSAALQVVVFGGTMGVVQSYMKKFSGALSTVLGGGCNIGALSCPSGNLSKFATNKDMLNAVNKNIEIYRRVGQQKNVPWEVLVGIHYRESNLNYETSMCSGERLGTPCQPNTSFVAQTFEESAAWAANHLQGKLTGQKLKFNEWNEDLIKTGLFRYNGAAGSYKDQAERMGYPHNPGYDGSPYVMNNFDQRHQKMNIVKRDYAAPSCCDGRDGAFTVASLLHNAQLDSNGKIISLGGCSATQSGEGTCGAVLANAAGASFGPTITGQYYPPHGDKMKSVLSVNTSPHGAAGHGVFMTSPFGGDFDKGTNGAIDYNVPSGSPLPVYSAFDGKVVSFSNMYHPKSKAYDDGGGIVWVKGNDGTSAAVYAHIEFSGTMQNGREFKKGEKIGMTAQKCGHSVDQCVSFKNSIHLHYQLYINKRGLSKEELLAAFPIK